MFYWFETPLSATHELFLCVFASVEYKCLLLWWNASVCLQVYAEATDHLGGVNSQECDCLCPDTSSLLLFLPALRSWPLFAPSDSLCVLLSDKTWYSVTVAPTEGGPSKDWTLCLFSCTFQEPYLGAPLTARLTLVLPIATARWWHWFSWDLGPWAASCIFEAVWSTIAIQWNLCTLHTVLLIIKFLKLWVP